MPKINQLNQTTSLSNTDVLAAENANGANTRKIAYASLRTQIQNESRSVFALHGEIASDEQVATAASDWLNAHVTPTGSTVALDDTLLIQGAASDAKATGEMIVINGSSSNSTRVNITTTDTDVQLALMDDLTDLAEKSEVDDLKSAIITALASDTQRILGTSAAHEDLDNYTTPGIYRVLYTADAAFVDNAPVTNTTYRLIVLETSANDVFMQIALINTRNNNSRFAVRSKMTSGWSEWAFLCDAAYTDAALSSARSTLFSLLESDTTDITGTQSNRTDLNDYRTPGNYKATSVTYIDNCPVPSVSFRLAVLQTTALNRVYQIMFCNSGGSAARIWIRHDPGTGNWSEWVAIADRAWTQQQLTGKLGLTHSDAAAIPDGSNLNSLTAGTYYVENATHAATMINGPVKNGGYLLITTELISATSYAQIAIINTNSGILYYRVKYSGTWTSWSKAFTTNDPAVITSETAARYFPNNSYNDVTDNAIYYLSSTLTLTDGPDGDNRIISPDGNTGSISGTLFVYSPQRGIGPKSTGVVQLLIGYRSGTYFPTLSYRIGSYSGSTYTWSKWSKFEQNGYLHASNQIIYGGSMIFSDLNDMPANSIYQLDLNLNGSDAAHTLAHHPAPGVSCVVMCYAYSYTSDHGKVQTLFTIDGRFYWRYGYYQAENDYRWTAWNQCVTDSGNYMQNKGRLANGSNLNDIFDNAIYLLGAQSGAAYVNNPLTGAGFLTAKKTNAICLQTVEGLDGTVLRRYSENSGSIWSAWTA